MVVKEGAIDRVDRRRDLLPDILDQKAHVAPSGGDRFFVFFEKQCRFTNSGPFIYENGSVGTGYRLLDIGNTLGEMASCFIPQERSSKFRKLGSRERNQTDFFGVDVSVVNSRSKEAGHGRNLRVIGRDTFQWQRFPASTQRSVAEGCSVYAFFESLRLRRAPVNQAQIYTAGCSCPGSLTTDWLSRVLRGQRGIPRAAALYGVVTRLRLSMWTSHFDDGVNMFAMILASSRAW